MRRTPPAYLALLTLVVAWAHPVAAGRTDTSPVQFVNFFGEYSVNGSFGSTRNDGPTLSYLACESRFQTPGDFFGTCEAQDALGFNAGGCDFPLGGQMSYQRVLSTIGPESFVSFSWADGSSQKGSTLPVCDSLYVYNDSFDEPKIR